MHWELLITEDSSLNIFSFLYLFPYANYHLIVLRRKIWLCVAVSANQRTQTHICEDRVYQGVWEGLPWRLTLNTYWLKYQIKSMVMEDGCTTNVKLGSSIIHPVPTCCMRITNIFKHGRYSYWRNAFIQHGRFDLLLENSW